MLAVAEVIGIVLCWSKMRKSVETGLFTMTKEQEISGGATESECHFKTDSGLVLLKLLVPTYIKQDTGIVVGIQFNQTLLIVIGHIILEERDNSLLKMIVYSITQ